MSTKVNYNQKILYEKYEVWNNIHDYESYMDILH